MNLTPLMHEGHGADVAIPVGRAALCWNAGGAAQWRSSLLLAALMVAHCLHPFIVAYAGKNLFCCAEVHIDPPHKHPEVPSIGLTSTSEVAKMYKQCNCAGCMLDLSHEGASGWAWASMALWTIKESKSAGFVTYEAKASKQAANFLDDRSA